MARMRTTLTSQQAERFQNLQICIERGESLNFEKIEDLPGFLITPITSFPNPNGTCELCVIDHKASNLGRVNPNFWEFRAGKCAIVECLWYSKLVQGVHDSASQRKFCDVASVPAHPANALIGLKRLPLECVVAAPNTGRFWTFAAARRKLASVLVTEIQGLLHSS